MMYLALFLSALLTLSQSAPGAAISPRTQLGLQILVTVAVAGRVCAGLEIDKDGLEEVGATYGITDEDVLDKYKEFTVAYASDLLHALKNDPDKFCTYAFRSFGPHGSIPGLLSGD